MIAGGLFADATLVSEWLGPAPGHLTIDGDGVGQRPYGLFMGGGGQLLGAHLVYILSIFAWTTGLMQPFFYLLKKFGILRVPPDAEAAGLDVSYHGGSSYPGYEGGGAAQQLYGRGGGGGKSDASVKYIMDRALEKALEEVERRGWTPPPPPPPSHPTSSSFDKNTNENHTTDENNNQLPLLSSESVVEEEVVVPSPSLAHMSAEIKKNFQE